MARSQNAFNKKEKEKKRLQKRKDKQHKKEERKANASQPGSGLDGMMAYVDEDGNLLDSPPDPNKKKEVIKASSIEINIPKSTEDYTNAERRGRVAFFDHTKGYGFINQDGSQERYFVHSSVLNVEVKEGDKVSFKSRKGLKGMEAYDIKVLGAIGT